MQVILGDLSTHPTVGSWAWGSQGIPYRVTRRFRESEQFFIVIASPNSDRTLPLSKITGWCPELPIGTSIVSDTGWPAMVIGFDPSDGMYRIEGECIVGWLYPDQFEVIDVQVKFTA